MLYFLQNVQVPIGEEDQLRVVFMRGEIYSVIARRIVFEAKHSLWTVNMSHFSLYHRDELIAELHADRW